ARFIIDNDDASPEIKRLAIALVNQGSVTPDSGTHKWDAESNHAFEIRMLRNNIRQYPKNPLMHVEIAHLYASSGLNEQANFHFRIALQLAPTNRFVLRSAARFDVHR